MAHKLIPWGAQEEKATLCLQVTPRELPGLEALGQGEDSDSDGDHLELLNGEAEGAPLVCSWRPWEVLEVPVHPAYPWVPPLASALARETG